MTFPIGLSSAKTRRREGETSASPRLCVEAVSRWRCLLLAAVIVPLSASAQGDSLRAEANSQQSFRRTVPAGNYSGIAWLGGDLYAVVDDKSETDGFRLFRISIDSISGRLLTVADEGFRSSASPNRDQEGIAWFPSARTLFISGEADNRILEYTLDGTRTGRSLSVPGVFATATANRGLESLTYNAATRRFWTTSESTLPADGPQATGENGVRNRLRLQSFGDDLQPADWFFYEMDAPASHKKAPHHAMGVSELCALDDGRLLVLERELRVPKRKLGAWVNCKLYIVNPAAHTPGTLLGKTLLLSFRTRLTLFGRSFANYEGMCLGPVLADGRRVLLMVSDSQGRYGGVLRDWFKTIVIGGQ